MRTLAAGLLALTLLFPSATAAKRAAAGRSTSLVSGLGIVELEIGYTTLATQYYRPVSGQTILDGAWTGIVAYLVKCGVTSPKIPFPKLKTRHPEDDIVLDVLTAAQLYGTRIDAGELIDAALAGELAAVHDPYTLLFRPAAYRKFVAFLDGSQFGGIGIEATIEPPATLLVSSVFPGDPAEKAGVLEGDVITAIDGHSALGLTDDQLGSLLRGKPGTTVRLSLRRNGVDLAQPIAIVRARIVPPEVIARMLPDRVGYLQLRTFGEQSGDQIARALDRLRAQGAQAYMLDLRGNGGGYRDAAIDVASHFIKSGPVVVVRSRGGARTTYPARKVPFVANPLVVLVDHDTASASEIVAGAIEDDRTGTLVGERTFGKALVQEVFPLPDAFAMKVTTARYFTPSGRDINGVGILPDIVLAEPKDARIGQPGADPQLDRGLAVLRGTSGVAPAAT